LSLLNPLPSSRLASLKLKVEKEPPPGFTELMVKLLISRLDLLEQGVLKVEEECIEGNCDNVLIDLESAVSRIESGVLSGDQGVFDHIDNLIKKLKMITSYLSLRNSMSSLATISAGILLIMASAVEMMSVSSFYMLVIDVIVASLSLAGLLLYKYSVGQILMIASAVILALSPNILYPVISSISAFLAGLAIMIKKNTYERLRGIRVEIS
jgi:hypothetical protein